MNEKDENMNGQKSLSEITESLGSNDRTKRELEGELIETAVKTAFDVHRDFFVHTVATRLGELGVGTVTPHSLPKDESGWTEIESMSRLRSIVGGRFQNLKERWTQAGLPLREHRGDKEKDFKIDERGWLELANWIAKQGYEVRLRADKPECLFEIRGK